MGNHWFWFWSM